MMIIILAVLLVVTMLTGVYYYGEMRYYRVRFEKESSKRKTHWNTVMHQQRRIVKLKSSNELLARSVVEQARRISKMDEENRELGQTVIDQGKLIEMKDEEINELEMSCQSPLRGQVSMLREEVIQKCNLNEALRGEVANVEELLRLAEEANIGHVKQIHQLQEDKAKVLAEFKDYRIFMIDDEIDPPEVNDTYFAHLNKNGFVYKWWKEERELAAKQIVEEELTASPEPCTEMGTKPADKSA